ncbi:uncharacterized protein N7498_008417 [Penicillium cinerascens]|uniref:Myb-like DNA-binding domain-containing protein n=1 Tax=Penicillium cinerascens TaxID=70096 RepID=A0A9W9MAS0_9EURO|nr:uncharacterized protein N7498_008417 [Penicillium cinerascens]KAJ5194979.1 hypothetical protein N7498_008417 [Penicillium cinerascens]
MPPKNTPNKVTKPAGKGKEAQTSPTASSPTKKGPRGSTGPSFDTVEFLWACFKNSGSPQVNYKAVGNELGLTAAAAKARFYRLRAQLDGDNKENKAGKATAKQEDEDAAETEDVEDSHYDV